jgi:HK97 family phage major capsid protein
LSAEVDRELVYEVKKAADAGVLSGSGSSPYLKGIATYATAGFSLTNIEIATPTIWDAISAAMNQVRQTGFDEANMIVMHPADYENALGSKDSQGRYVGHPSLAPDGLRFAGIPITTSTFITAGYILVGNKMKSHIRVKQDMELAIGYNLTGEFAKRLLTVRASMRMAHYIKDNDIYSFVYDAIADIKAAITKV